MIETILVLTDEYLWFIKAAENTNLDLKLVQIRHVLFLLDVCPSSLVYGNKNAESPWLVWTLGNG